MHLNISPSAVHLAEVRRTARRALMAVPAEVASDLLVALDEAVANAVRHGSAGGGPVEVFVDVTDEWVELRILDRGPTTAPPALPAGPPSPMALGGRGLWMIRELADEVRVEPAGSGTLLAIRRRTGRGHHGGPKGPSGTPAGVRAPGAADGQRPAVPDKDAAAVGKRPGQRGRRRDGRSGTGRDRDRTGLGGWLVDGYLPQPSG